MSTVTDKELLTLCNLANLKMEFAKLTYFNVDEQIKVNHTIYTLIRDEIFYK